MTDPTPDDGRAGRDTDSGPAAAVDPRLDELLRLDHQLCFAVYSTALAFNAAYKPLLDPLGLTYPQYLVMLVLWEREDLMVKEVGERLHLDSGTLTPLLKRLEAAGLVQRRRDRADERQVRIHLTDAGRALRERAHGVPLGMLQTCGIGVDALRELRERLEVLRGRLDAVRA